MSTGTAVLSFRHTIRLNGRAWLLVGVLTASALTTGLFVGRAGAPAAVRTRVITQVVPAFASSASAMSVSTMRPYSDLAGTAPVWGAARICPTSHVASTRQFSEIASTRLFSDAAGAQPLLGVEPTCSYQDLGVQRENGRW